jgi:hypothetical protein
MLDQLLAKEAAPEEIERLKGDLAHRLEVVERARQAVEEANIPTVTHHSAFRFIEELGTVTYDDVDGTPRSYLDPDEIVSLTVSRGTLTAVERLEIETHVTHTYDFLSTIPWTRDLMDIPELARSHHEKLDGADPVVSADIPPRPHDDHLRHLRYPHRQDRPYKPAVPTTKALAILEEDAGRAGSTRPPRPLHRGEVFLRPHELSPPSPAAIPRPLPYPGLIGPPENIVLVHLTNLGQLARSLAWPIQSMA